MTCSVHASQPPSPATAVTAHEQSGRGGGEGVCAWAQQHGRPLAQAFMVTSIADGPICQQWRPTLSPQLGAIAQDGPPATWWQVDCIVPFPSWKRQCVVLTGIDPRSGYTLPSLHTVLLLEPPSVGSRCFVCVHGPLSHSGGNVLELLAGRLSYSPGL